MSAEQYLSEAHQLYDASEYDKARSLCERIMKLFPARTDNLLLLGAIHYQMRNVSAAAELNMKAIQQDPELAEAHGNLGNCLKDQGNLVGAVESYRRALVIKPRFVDAHTNLAAALAELHQFEDSIKHYRRALAIQPNHPDALNNLGNLYKQQGVLEEALKAYSQALELRPSFAAAHSNLASVYRDLGDQETALKHFALAIQYDPNLADAYSNMGNVYKDMGNWDLAEKCYTEAIRLRPSFAIAHGNLGSIYVDRGQHDQAVEKYTEAIAIDNNQPDFFDNIGLAYRGKGQLDLAIQHHQYALKLQPNRAHTLNNLGNALKERGMLKESMDVYLEALRLSPNFAAAHSNLANVYREQGRHQLALDHYRFALQINPSFADVYSNMGNVFKDQGRFEDAIEHYKRAIALNRNFADAHSNLASVYKDTGKLREAIVCYRIALSLKPFFPDAFCNLLHSLQMICCWENRAELMEQLRLTILRQMEMGQTPSVQPHHALVYPLDGSTVLTIAQAYAAQVSRNAACFVIPPMLHPTTLTPQGRLRLGYVSSDFGNHPLSDLMGSVFGLHDKSRFEVFCYALSPDDHHPNYSRIRREVEHFVDISAMSIEQTVMQINNDRIHILVNLNGYTKGARNEAFALQPAPIQVSYMGFPGSMGASFIQYLITDQITTPPAAQSFFTEKFAYMPHCYFVTDYKTSFRAVLDRAQQPTRTELGLPENAFIFYCANQLYKIDPATFDVWCSILLKVPNSVLWLLRFPAIGEQYILEEAARRGVPSGRIVFTDQAMKHEHIRRSAAADLFLDTPVCNGHTTACDVLWAGVPIITMPLQSMASRVAASVCTNLGCPDMIVNSYEEYEARAIMIATNPSVYRTMRDKIETLRHTSPLFDTTLWVREVEECYLSMWRLHASGNPPQTFIAPAPQSQSSSGTQSMVVSPTPLAAPPQQSMVTAFSLLTQQQ